jgi:hypothetical protein
MPCSGVRFVRYGLDDVGALGEALVLEREFGTRSAVRDVLPHLVHECAELGVVRVLVEPRISVPPPPDAVLLDQEVPVPAKRLVDVIRDFASDAAGIL